MKKYIKKVLPGILRHNIKSKLERLASITKEDWTTAGEDMYNDIDDLVTSIMIKSEKSLKNV